MNELEVSVKAQNRNFSPSLSFVEQLRDEIRVFNVDLFHAAAAEINPQIVRKEVLQHLGILPAYLRYLSPPPPRLVPSC